ncbi:SHOCT domain-containing protein [Oricola cellulosilytica]|uniref:SHOCT domain-containing protein n=1 Tax=Oricola cellulosilytica TaxID=1429082 RepID=UPI0013049DF8|nr:SHOCT domain-containing protein [Oricola cellulosilytica]
MQKILLGSVALGGAVPAAMAQDADTFIRGAYGPGMMWGGYGTGFGMIFGPFLMILIFIATVAGIIYLLRAFGLGAVEPDRHRSADRAMTILKERFARGEIDAKEFDERRRTLTD